MNDNRFKPYIDEQKFDELESVWVEKLAGEDVRLPEYLQAIKELAFQKEKDRASVLMDFLAESLLEKEDWGGRLTVLREIARHFSSNIRFDDLKHQILVAVQKIHSDKPSLKSLLRHYSYEDSKTPVELLSRVKEIEGWLAHDVGSFFYMQDYGAGKVTEINLKLGLVRLDFESRKDVAVERDDKSLIPLEKGNILREKLEDSEPLRGKMEADPGQELGRLLRFFKEPVTVNRIKESFSGLLETSQWTRWWTHARKHPQVLSSGKGAQAVYSWSDSHDAVEFSVRKEFLEAKPEQKIQIAKQNLSRSPDLEQFFAEKLVQEAVNLKERNQNGTLIELLELLEKWPGKKTPVVPFTLDDLIRANDPNDLVQSAESSQSKLHILSEVQKIFPDASISVLEEAFLKETNQRVIGYAYDQIFEKKPALIVPLIEKVLTKPALYPAIMTWFSEVAASKEPSSQYEPLVQRLDAKFLLTLFNLLDEPEFATYRNRIKKALESGLLLNLLSQALDPEVVHKAVDVLMNTRAIEDYRRERFRAAMLARYPAAKKPDDFIFSTREAFEEKRKELDDLIKVQLPTNRKAIGEAAAHGDLRENHEYKAARERQEYLINRVQQLQHDLNRVRVLEPEHIDGKEVRPGTTIVLVQPPDKKRIVTVLGPWDSDPNSNVYSYQAPIGVALLGKTQGDNVTLNEEVWTIERIEPWKS